MKGGALSAAERAAASRRAWRHLGDKEEGSRRNFWKPRTLWASQNLGKIQAASGVSRQEDVSRGLGMRRKAGRIGGGTEKSELPVLTKAEPLKSQAVGDICVKFLSLRSSGSGSCRGAGEKW